MQTILDFTKEIVDKILKYDDEIDLTITEDSTSLKVNSIPLKKLSNSFSNRKDFRCKPF